MKKINIHKQNTILLGLLLLSFISRAQLIEDFSDGNFSENPAWIGDTSVFRIQSSTAIPADMRPALQLYDEDANTSYLSTPVSFPNTDSLLWSFWVKLSFAPSANNNARFYLISDNPDLKSAGNGMFVSVAETDKRVSLYSESTDSVKLLIEGPIINKSTNAVRVKVEKDIQNRWKLFVDTLGGYNFDSYGEKSEAFAFENNFSVGLYTKYTKSNSKKIYWDDIEVLLLEEDTEKPFVISFEEVLPNKIHLYFSEELDSVSASDERNYVLSPHIEPIYTLFENRNKVTIEYYPDFEKNVEYALTVKGVQDKAGNVMSEETFKFIFEEYVPSGRTAIDEKEILINEVLFNPLAYGSDFVEIYNHSSDDLSLDSLCLATWDYEKQEVAAITPLGIGLTLPTNDYLVFTKDKENILTNYQVLFPDKCIQLKSLPTYPDKEGTVILCTNAGKIIDRFDYSESMHFQLLSTKDGVSLERRSFLAETNDADNWQSAAKTVGWATPTYKNSQYSEFLYLEEPFTIEPNPFSPDLDGIDDFLNINYKMNESGLLCNITIFDSKGRLVRNLKRNEYLGMEGTFVWDGINEENRKASIGNYVVFVEVFNTKGDTKQYKNVITLLGR